MMTSDLIHPAASHLPIFPRLIATYLLEAGFSELEIFQELGFSSQDLENEAFRLDTDQHERFIRRAIDLTQNVHLSLDMKDHAFEATSNAVLILFATSGRISKALHLITRFNPIYTRTVTSKFEESPDCPLLSVVSHLHDDLVAYFALSSFTLFVDTFFKDALGGQHLVTHARMAISPPKDFLLVASRFGFEIEFGADRTEIFLDPHLINKPIKKADAQTTRLIMEFCEKQLSELNAEVSVVGTVSALIYEQIATPPTLDEAAASIGQSSRSLRRHLQSSGTTYQSILNDARKALAVKLLRETDEPVSAIAYEVGFENPSHFGRAFKKWMGTSPTAFRNR